MAAWEELVISMSIHAAAQIQKTHESVWRTLSSVPSSSTLSVLAVSPAEGGKGRGWAEALSQRWEGFLNQKGCGSAPAPLKLGG